MGFNSAFEGLINIVCTGGSGRSAKLTTHFHQ